jgi:hypothetical protein
MMIPALPRDGIPAAQLAEYDGFIQGLFEKVVELVSGGDWTKTKQDGDITFFSRFVPGSNFMMLKSQLTIPLPFERVLKRFSLLPPVTADTPPGEREGAVFRLLLTLEPNEWNDGFVYLVLDSGTRVVRNRDFLMYRKHFERDGIHYFIQGSMVNDAIAPATKEFVRGKMLTQGVVVDSDPASGEPRVTCIAHADPAGAIPAIIYNAVVQKQGSVVKKLKADLLAGK